MATASSILPLPPEVLSQIRSSVTIASLNDAVLNLIKNSLDSHASSIDVTVDYGRGSCDVEDNGLGIEPVEFSANGGLGKLHHTSKHTQLSKTHGGQGSFLALLSALALVSITSLHDKYRYPNTISMHRSKVIALQIPATAQHRISDKDHGTRVTVRDLFGSMPVRVRQRTSEPAANDKDWQILRKIIIGLLLAWPNTVSITVRNVLSNQKMRIRSNPDVNIVGHVCSILSQAMFITPPEKEFWVSTTGSTGNLLISGTMSIEPCPHKNIQFLCFNIYPMVDCNGSNVLYEHINRIFSKSSFGNDEDETIDDGDKHKRIPDARNKQNSYTNKQLKSSKKGANKWPMFCLKIEARDINSSLGEVVTDEFLDKKGGHLDSVMDLLREMVVGFLKQHHFRIDSRGERRAKTRDVHSKSTTSSRTAQKTAEVAISHGKNGLGFEKLPHSNLATGIKLPSFSKGLSSNSESPFHTWTRIKRGEVRNEQKDAKTSSTLRTGMISSGHDFSSNVELTSSRKLVKGITAARSSNLPFNPLAKVTEFAKASLIDFNGKVSRPPFNLNDSGQHEQESNVQHSDIIVMPPGSSDDSELSGDNLVSWINPITKEKSLISNRTGMVVTPQSPNLPQSSLKSRKPITQMRQSFKIEKRSRREPTTWVSGLLNSWDNPVFKPAELPIPQISIDGLDIKSQQILHGQLHDCTPVDIDKAFTQSSGGLSGRLTKNALRNAKIISQVDKKFILIKISTTDRESLSDPGRADPNLLVLVDQHAADERCRVEDLLSELCMNHKQVPLEPPLSFAISNQELQLFQRYMEHFENWGILYEIHDWSHKSGPASHVKVRNLPLAIVERCRHEPTILTKLMKAEIWKISQGNGHATSRKGARQHSDNAEGSEWFSKLWNCPEGILDIVNSRSCRSAIMFNDELDHQQCKTLIERLAHCSFPFQCAHGRPSMIPLVDLSVVLQNPT